jgi:hypothetical protein
MSPEKIVRAALTFSASRTAEERAHRATCAARTAGRCLERAIRALTAGRPTAHHTRRAQSLAAVRDLLRLPPEQARAAAELAAAGTLRIEIGGQ